MKVYVLYHVIIVFEKVEAKSFSAPGSDKKKSQEGKSRIEKMRSSSLGIKLDRRLDRVVSIGLKRYRANDGDVCMGPFQLKIFTNIAIVSDFGNERSLPISSLKYAEVILLFLWLVF